MRFTSKILCTGLLIATAGCSWLNPFASKPSPRTQPAPLVEFKSTMDVRTVWTASVGKSEKYVFTPVSVGNFIFAASEKGTVAKIEADTGRTVWRIDADTKLTAGVGSDGMTVVVAAENGTILAFDAEDGKQRWKARASSEVLSAPAIGQSVVVVRSMDNRITAFDADDGSRKWTVQRTAPALTLRTSPGIAIAGPNAYIGLSGGRLLAVALATGAPRWEVAVGDPRGVTELERIADISGTPLVAGRDVCAVAYQGRVACFDAVSGTPRWAAPLSSDVGVAADNRFVYAANEEGTVMAISRMGGGILWRNNKLKNRRLSTPIASGRAVAVGDYQGYVHFLSKDDGSFLARVATDGSAIMSVPLTVGGNLVFQTQSGTVAALAAE
ncbi:MAG TPA: outer membrane protein assembly factor BamB [Oxalicibacterium sp.]